VAAAPDLALASGKNFDADPALAPALAPAPTLLCRKFFSKSTKAIIRFGTVFSMIYKD
jgi:hypothetical protein